MERTSFARMRCSMARGLDLIGDWWTPLILRDLFLGITRFEELAQDLGISRNLLTRRLAALRRNGIVERQIYQTRPKRFAYGLSEAGADLVPVLLALTEWGDRWAQPRQGRPIQFLHTRCNCLFRPRITCSECGEEVTAREVRGVGGPGGAARRGTMLLAQRLGEAASRR